MTAKVEMRDGRPGMALAMTLMNCMDGQDGALGVMQRRTSGPVATG